MLIPSPPTRTDSRRRSALARLLAVRGLRALLACVCAMLPSASLCISVVSVVGGALMLCVAHAGGGPRRTPC